MGDFEMFKIRPHVQNTAFSVFTQNWRFSSLKQFALFSSPKPPFLYTLSRPSKPTSLGMHHSGQGMVMATTLTKQISHHHHGIKLRNLRRCPNQKHLNAFHAKPRYPSMPRSSTMAAFKHVWTLIKLRHKTLLWVCLMFVILETLLGFPMKSSCCWHDVARGDITHEALAAPRLSSKAACESMCAFG